MKKTFAVASLVACALAAASAQTQGQGQNEQFRFRTGVELINVTATVTDRSGRFVPGLRKEDFRVYQDEELQNVTQFDSERVPVSLGIVLDTSGSMAGEKMVAAREALNRFLFDLLGPEDEVFLYRFDATPQLAAGWTRDRRQISDELMRIQPRGGTALYDAVSEAIPLAQSGRHRKKAIVIISDGNDTNSRIDVGSLKEQIRETEVLVYAIGIDAQVTTMYDPQPRGWPGGIIRRLFDQRPTPFPFPIPGTKRPPRDPRGPSGPTGGTGYPPRLPPPSPPTTGHTTPTGSDRVNVAALREITDDSGGRTEIVRGPRDLAPATAGIADELSRQYYLGYPAAGQKDGRWHSIRVEVRNRDYHVRARRGFVATP
jgi:VWFA-related protein